MRKQISFFLNGNLVEPSAEYSKFMLADYLREELGLVGTKIVCSEGDCGACSILKYNKETSLFDPVNSLLDPGRSVIPAGSALTLL